MKQALAVALALMLLVSSLVPRMSTQQAVHLPDLLSHYHQHQREEGRQLSFWAFLLEHYALDSQHHKAPNHSHSRLPAFDGGSSTYDLTAHFRLVCEPLITELTAAAVFRLPTMNARPAFASLLQPPRA